MKFKKLFNLVALLTVLMVGYIGCKSSGTDGGGDSGSGDIYVSGDSAGRIELELNESNLPVAEVAGFRVRVFDKDGRPVPFIQVSCDTEADLALIEPSSGTFTMDENGQGSGVYGCADRGSFLMGCRLAVGGNKRVFKTVICSGERPNGFDGFPGAGGGGLNNGVSDNPDPSDDNAIRITDIAVTESGDSDTTSIDLYQIPDCDTTDDTVTAEPFSDTIVKFTVLNDTTEEIRFDSYRYTIGNYDGSSDFTSDEISLIGEEIQGGGASVSFQALMFDVCNGTVADKCAVGDNNGIPTVGFKEVTFELFGTSASGEDVVREASVTLSFDGYNRCG